MSNLGLQLFMIFMLCRLRNLENSKMSITFAFAFIITLFVAVLMRNLRSKNGKLPCLNHPSSVAECIQQCLTQKSVIFQI